MGQYALNFDLEKLSSLKELKLNRKELKKPDELDLLVSSFNQMKSNLQRSHEQLLDYSKNLELKIKDATMEISEEKNKIKNLLDKIQVSIFVIGKDFKILPPVSRFSDYLFQKNIVGLHISQVLFLISNEGRKIMRTFRKTLEKSLKQILKTLKN